MTNITRLSGVTHSARIFSAPDLPIRPANANGKSKVVTEEANEANPTLDEDVLVGRFAEKGEGLDRKEVSLEETNELLCIIQQSKF